MFGPCRRVGPEHRITAPGEVAWSRSVHIHKGRAGRNGSRVVPHGHQLLGLVLQSTGLTRPSSGRAKAGSASLVPPLKSNVRRRMPSLRVLKNGDVLCVAGSADAWTFTAAVYADIWGPERSTLTVTGSGRSDGGTRDFLVWQLGYELKTGDRLEFSFVADEASSPRDNSLIDEPSEDEATQDFFAPIPEDELQALEGRTIENAACQWQVKFEGREAVCVAPDSQRQHCSLHMTWVGHRIDQLRVSLSKSSLREISSRSGGEELFLEYVPFNYRVGLEIKA